MQKICVFVCHCGTNIAGTVDVKAVAEALGKEPGVVFSAEYPYMCSEAGQNLIKNAIKEGEEKFDVEIDEADAKKLVETMEKLEDMGFSIEYVVQKADSLYQEHGADFVEHVDEVVTGAVKDAASNVANSFFEGLKTSVKSFFQNLFQ